MHDIFAIVICFIRRTARLLSTYDDFFDDNSASYSIHSTLPRLLQPLRMPFESVCLCRRYYGISQCPFH